ncbi:MAG: hypothetical protein COV70_00605 [Parcubacteria group bacterium CG11_big_fil_rev_8_21_14_0_20_39_22]|nr:MAG: hypothetical protein COV70_00605 [Parcubacteria group bacterium CG11_big_fil_rev_8_21_14_0_20_39_22]
MSRLNPEFKNKKSSVTNTPTIKRGVFIVIIVLLTILLYVLLNNIFSVTYSFDNSNDATIIDNSNKLKDKEKTPNKPRFPHIDPPESLRAVYMTSCVASTPSIRKNLVELIEETEINAVIIDIKDYTGKLAFDPGKEELAHAVPSDCFISDLPQFLSELNQKGIYTIARITVFQDSHFAVLNPEVAVLKKSDGTVWSDYKKLHFTDPGSKEVWDYIISISESATDIGFDELNFDYIRFPSDGPMKDISFPKSGDRPKQEVLESFFSYLKKEIDRYGEESGYRPVISADLFGMTTNAENFDLNIGQVWERVLPYFDYLSPMIYPSHYPPGFNGWSDPNKYPYEIIKFALDRAVQKTIATTTLVAFEGAIPISTTTPMVYSKPTFPISKIRPWLQDFDYGGTYDVAEVRAQIQATYDAGIDSWMLWSPSNKYTRGALKATSDI